MKLVHYSQVAIEKLHDRKYELSNIKSSIYVLGSKPMGLWVSIENEKKDGWADWCIAEKFCLHRLKYQYEIKLFEKANILILDTSDKILSFSKEYCIDRGDDRIFGMETYGILWPKVKEKYQGIIISPYQWDCRMSTKCMWYYSWDCASGCIWDLSAIKSFERIDVLDDRFKDINFEPNEEEILWGL